MMKKRKVNAFLILGIIMLAVSISYLLEVMLQPDNIWWTPASMELTLDETKDRVEVYVDGRIIQDVVKDQHLWVAKGQKIQPVKVEDVGIRLNNWSRVRAQQVPRVIYLSVIFALGVVFLIAGVLMAMGRLSFRKK